MGRTTKDPIWFHFNSIRKFHSGDVFCAQCKYCGIKMSGVVQTLRLHHDSCDGKRVVGDEDDSAANSDNGNDSVSSTGSGNGTRTKCLLCGDSAEEYTVDYNLSLWDENCSKSFCKLFNLESSWRRMLLKASYCHKCHNILRDIDFSLRTLQLLEDKLQHSRSTVENLLTENYEGIKERDGEVYDGDEEDYTEMVKMFYRSVLPNSSDYEEVEEFKRSAKASIPRSQHPQGVDKQPPGDIYSNSGSCHDLEDDIGGGPVDADDEPHEFDPQSRVEVIIKQDMDDDGSDLSDPEVNTDDFSTPDDSSDEDWEMETSKKKGKVKGKVPPVPVKIVTVLKPPPPKIKVIKVLTPKPTAKPVVFISRPTGGGTDNANPERRVIWVARPDTKKVPAGGSKGQPFPNNQNAVGRIKCTEEGCTFTCTIPYKLDAHVNKIHKGDPKPFHCKTCEAKFGSNSTYYLHQRTCRNGTGDSEVTGDDAERNKLAEPQPCEICQKPFTTRKQLKKHMAVRHPLGKMIHCPSCSKMFEKQEDLDVHEGLHKGRIVTMPFSCVLCESGYTNSLDLKTHVRQEHEPLLQANKCGECSKVFLTDRSLKRHILTVHSERPEEFKCSKPGCSFTGRNQKTLDKHVALHNAPRDFVCEICGQGYKAKSGLNYHMRAAHSETKNYACQICGKRFVSGCLLKAHEESHNTVKSYICETCGKAFMAKKNLEQHNKSHLGIKIRYGKRFKNTGNGGNPPKARKRRGPSPSHSSRSKDDEEMDEDVVSEPSSSPSSVYERHEPNPPTFDERPQQHSSGFQQLIPPVVPAPHFLMGEWPIDRVQSQPMPGHQFQSQGPTNSAYPYTTIDLSHTSQLLSVLHQQQQQRRSGSSSAQGHLQHYFNPNRGQH